MSIRDVVRDLRQRLTPAEKLLWKHVRSRKCGGIKIKRQHPIVISDTVAGKEFVVADFMINEVNLVIEVDGLYHFLKEQELKDHLRTKTLNELGYDVIRFTNEEVLNDVVEVLRRIQERYQELKK
jgi:leucyl-tRNA synthetase